MYQKDFPNRSFRFFPRWSLWYWGGGAPPTAYQPFEYIRDQTQTRNTAPLVLRDGPLVLQAFLQRQRRRSVQTLPLQSREWASLWRCLGAGTLQKEAGGAHV